MNLTKPSLKTGMNESVVKEIKENPPELGKKYITLDMKELQYYITLYHLKSTKLIQHVNIISYRLRHIHKGSFW